MKDTSLTQFVRDRKGNARGLVVATIINNQIRLGWSYTNTTAGDNFDKQLAYHIAFGRAEFGWGPNVRVPHSVNKVLNRMQHRANRYYKQSTDSSYDFALNA